MKKSATMILITLTLAFVAFVIGFYLGRQSEPTNIQIQGVDTIAPTIGKTPVDTTGRNPDAPSPTPTAGETQPQYPLDINTATVSQLDTLPGIGPVIAQAIVDYRSEFGPFTSVEDLLRVPGIGEKRLEAILEFIYVAGGNHEDSSCG